VRPHNYIEDHVFDVADRLTAADAEFCGCEKCLTDVSAFALSQLKPAYATGDTGRAMTVVRLGSVEVQTEISAQVVAAIDAVKRHPRH
jgi:hypothetical protein